VRAVEVGMQQIRKLSSTVSGKLRSSKGSKKLSSDNDAGLAAKPTVGTGQVVSADLGGEASMTAVASVQTPAAQTPTPLESTATAKQSGGPADLTQSAGAILQPARVASATAQGGPAVDVADLTHSAGSILQATAQPREARGPLLLVKSNQSVSCPPLNSNSQQFQDLYADPCMPVSGKQKPISGPFHVFLSHDWRRTRATDRTPPSSK